MVAPERRTRVDILVACAIAVVLLLAGAVVWLRSDASGTTSVTAEHPAAPAETALSVPENLTEVWHAGSGATRAPLVAGGAVVTANDGTVLGRDPVTGNELWRYQRDMPLCGAVGAWHTAVAVYRDRLGCGQVTQLDGSTGVRQAQRNSDADESVVLSQDGTYLTSRGSTRLEVWRSDLVRTLEFGRVDAPVNPGAQPRSGCVLLSSASSTSRLAVLQRCPGESADRISLLNPAPKDNTKPEEYGSTVLDDTGPGAAVLAVSGDRTAVYVPPGGSGGARIAVYDGSGSLVTAYPVNGVVAPTTRTVRSGSIFSWWTGSRVITLRSTDLTPGWTVEGALGPGTSMAGQFLVPVDGAVAVLDPATGAEIRRIPVDRRGTTGGEPITSAALGSVLLEQRGDDLVALR